MARTAAVLLTMCILTPVCVGESVPLLPFLTQRELARAVAESQTQYQRYRAQYRLTYGKVVDADGLTGTFVPKEPSYTVDGDFAVEHSSRSVYLREDMVVTDERKHCVTEAAFHGDTDVGTELRQGGPGSGDWFGKVCHGLPDSVAPLTGVHHPRPDDVLFWHIDGTGLASVIQDAEACRTQTCFMNGLKCYRITLRLVTEKTVIIPGRKKEVRAKERALYRVWLAPELNMLPVRLDHLRIEDASDTDGETEERWVMSDFRQVPEDLPFPHRARRYVLRAKSDPVAIDMVLKFIQLGDAVEIPVGVTFPVGTHVTNEVEGRKYRQGHQ